MRLNKERFWKDRFYNYGIKSAMATFKRSTFSIRERYIVSVSSNFLTQISCGIKTKCRKTRAMLRDFTIVDSLALRQCNTSLIPDTHLLKLLFLTRYYLPLNLHSSYIYQRCLVDSLLDFFCSASLKFCQL